MSTGEGSLEVAGRRATYMDFPSAESVPTYAMVPIAGPTGETLRSYRGVRRMDTGEVVSIVSDRYGLVQHRDIARAIEAVASTLDRPDNEVGGLRASGRPGSQSIRLYSNGRRMEVKLVIGQKFKLDSENEFYPAVRVLNSLDGAWAVRVEAFGVRLACTNQMYAGAGSYMEFRELHLSSPEDLMGHLEKAIYEALDHFDGALDLYAQSMNQLIPVSQIAPRLVGAGLPQRHVNGMAGGLPQYFGSVLWGEISRWDAYNMATDYLSHQVQVNPERERQFERMAARALLLPETAAQDGERAPI